MAFSLKHDVNSDVENFWSTFFDDIYNETLFREVLGFPRYTVLQQRDDPSGIFREVSATPKLDLPPPVAKLLGDSFAYVERGTFDRASGIWRWVITPSVMQGKLKAEGTLRVEAAGENKLVRYCDIRVEAKVFGVGGLIESVLEKNLRRGWEVSAEFSNTWFATHPRSTPIRLR